MKRNKKNRPSREPRKGQQTNAAHQKQHRQKMEEVSEEQTANCVFGYHATNEALQQGRGNKLFLQEDSRGSKIETLKLLAKERSVPVKWVPKPKLDLLTGQAVHQGYVLTITAYDYLSLTELLEQTQKKTATPFFLLLDSIEDPHNFGSILRTADATNVDGIIIPKHRAVGITSVVTKTSTGAVEYVPVARVTNLAQSIATLKQQNFWVFGTSMTGMDYRKWTAQGAVALVIGNEGRGMSQRLQKEVDEMLTIPMNGHVQSLNASVAAGLLMYEAYRKRTPL